MNARSSWGRRFVPIFLGVITLADVAVLLVWDAAPGLFPAGSHNILAAFSLTAIAAAYLLYQAMQRTPLLEFVKAILLASAFLLWAANQLWPDLPQATLFNDGAIGLFVLDIFLVIVGWPPAPTASSFAKESGAPDVEEQL